MSLLLLQSLRDSVATSVSMNLFESRERASMAHIFNSKFLEIPLSTFTDVDNFNPDRLQSSADRAYPVHDDDIRSVDYYQSQIREGGTGYPDMAATAKKWQVFIARRRPSDRCELYTGPALHARICDNDKKLKCFFNPDSYRLSAFPNLSKS
jgi:hypothetical protein